MKWYWQEYTPENKDDLMLNKTMKKQQQETEWTSEQVTNGEYD